MSPVLVWTCWVTNDQFQQCVASFSPEKYSEMLTLPTDGDEGIPTYEEHQAFWHVMGVMVRKLRHHRVGVPSATVRWNTKMNKLRPDGWRTR